jgi:hypothetical protein
MIWWPIIKPVIFMSSEILVALPFSLGEKVAGKARRMRGTAPNASSPLGKGRAEGFGVWAAAPRERRETKRRLSH